MMDQAEFESRLPALFRQPAPEDDAAAMLAGLRRRVWRTRALRFAILACSLGAGAAVTVFAILASARPGLKASADLWARLAAELPAPLAAQPGLVAITAAAIVLIGLAGLGALRDA